MKHRVVATNIETFRRDGGGFEKLWRSPEFVQKVISIIWDEGHCVSKWADIRPEYKDIERLRYLLPKNIPFYITSATLPPIVLQDVMDILHVRPNKVEIIRRSNDRPNVHLVVRKMVHPANSFLDLAWLIPENLPSGWKPPKFLIFFDSIAESISAAKFLRGRLPFDRRHLIKWFNADMSSEFRDEELDNMKRGDTWGLTCTDSFGMVSATVNSMKLEHLRKIDRASTYQISKLLFNGVQHVICAHCGRDLVAQQEISSSWAKHYSLSSRNILMRSEHSEMHAEKPRNKKPQKD